METLPYLIVIMLLAGFIQGFSGFGSVLLSLPLLALFMDVKTAIPLVAMMGVVLTILLLIPLWKELEWRRIWPLLAGAAPGVPLGVFMLKLMDGRLILTMLGVILVCYSLYGLLFPVIRRELGGIWAYVTGFLAGCFGGAFSAAGPPVIIYVSLQPWRKELIKVTLQGFYFASGLMVVTAQAITGMVTDMVLELFLYSLVPLTLGTYAGHFFFGKIKEETYRRVILILLLCLGVFTVWKAS
ncbi:MAG: sulfite exporter TauE/SafE family protein [Syntrophales bacterium]